MLVLGVSQTRVGFAFLDTIKCLVTSVRWVRLVPLGSLTSWDDSRCSGDSLRDLRFLVHSRPGRYEVAVLIMLKLVPDLDGVCGADECVCGCCKP